MKRVLAFDQALRTGHTSDDPAGGKPVSGVIRLSVDGDDYGGAFVEFERHVGDLIAVHAPDVVAFESPMVVRGNSVITTAQTIRLLFGLASIIELVANRCGVETFEVNNMTWKKHFVGDGHARKGDTIARVRMLGWSAPNHDVADSIGIWAFAKSVLDPTFAYQTTPMFARARA